MRISLNKGARVLLVFMIRVCCRYLVAGVLFTVVVAAAYATEMDVQKGEIHRHEMEASKKINMTFETCNVSLLYVRWNLDIDLTETQDLE